jgi:hypothetical protein
MQVDKRLCTLGVNDLLTCFVHFISCECMVTFGVCDRLGKYIEANHAGAMENMGLVIPSDDMNDSHRSSQAINRAVCICMCITNPLIRQYIREVRNHVLATAS